MTYYTKPSVPASIPIDEIPLSRGEKLVFEIVTYRGKTRFDMRIFYPDDDGVLKAGKGVAISLRHLPWLIAIAEQALAEAIAHDLVRVVPGVSVEG